MTERTFASLATVALLAVTPIGGESTADSFDHSYAEYGRLLRRHVIGIRVDYTALRRKQPALNALVSEFGQVTTGEFVAWSDTEQIAYLINAYNVFTLKAVIDHYPIKRRWFDFFNPPNSIKQIPGVWSRLRWRAAGNEITLDDIEHGRLRRHYNEPRIHFAVNCASVSCPPLRPEPYVAARLERQLIIAAREFLASDLGVEVNEDTLRVSRMLNWFGDDFIEQYSRLVETNGSAKARALVGVIAKYGPPEAARVAQSGNARIRFLKYDWSLNDTAAR